jgi:hydrophobic/amphiphilic exporter-1 (mainly G- bacteria), HAE1 family
MNLSDVAIRRPVFTAMMSFTIIVLGLLGYFRLGTDLYPDVSFPFVTITTLYPGASPLDLEENVTRPIEDAVSGIAGVDRVFSKSTEGGSQVQIQFLMSVPMGEAVQLVRDKVGIAQSQLPLGTKQPVITQMDISAQPVLVFSVNAGKIGVTLPQLREVIDDRIRPQLEQLDGVAAVRILGGAEAEISVELFPDRLANLGITPDIVFQKIRGENLDLPAGRYISGQTEVGVRVSGEFADVSELRDMVVTTSANGSQVKLSDIALVKSGTKEPRTLVRTNGVEAIGVEVVKQSGANSAKVAISARSMLAEIEKQFSLKTHVLIDQSTAIEANSHEVWIAIYFGGAMAILIILLFLLDVRGTVISSLALPTSVFGTLFAMYVLGYSINQLTLLGLSLAIGLLIDDAVVVRESITRRLEAGEPPALAASNGTKEIALAVLATTLTLCAVFIPVGFMQGIVGQFFKQFGITITAAVLFSLFIAFTLDPMLSARFAKTHTPGSEVHSTKLARALSRVFARMDDVYGITLSWVLEHRKLTFVVAVSLFVSSIIVGKRLGSEFMPVEDRGDLQVQLEFPPGTSLESTSKRSEMAELAVRALPGVTTVYSVVGPTEDVRRASWRVKMVEKEKRRTTLEDYKRQIRKVLASIPQVKATVTDPPIIEGIGNQPPIRMQVVGRDFDVLRKEAEHLAEVLRSVPGTIDVLIQDSPGKPVAGKRRKRSRRALRSYCRCGRASNAFGRTR